jgi:uncharacterized protein (DUF1800 family)
MRSRLLVLLLFTLTLVSALSLVASDKNKRRKTSASAQMDENQRALHVLNRFTFGPRPGDLQRVEQMGADKWFEQQLQPDKIDDSTVQARLAQFRTLTMNPHELMASFPPPQLVKAVENGKAGIPRDPQEQAIYRAALERQQQKQQRKQNAANAQSAQMDDNADMENTASGRKGNKGLSTESRVYDDITAESLTELPPDQRFQAIMKLPVDEQREMFKDLSQEQRERMGQGFTPQQRETLQAIVNPPAVVQNELTQAKLLRAIYSERQLEEVMTDFWVNHFNVFINKGAPERYLIGSYERDAIRPHALGKFQDLLVATAKSPAMLFYLDNWQSIGPNSDVAKYGPRGNPAMRQALRRRGLAAILFGDMDRRPAQRPGQQPNQKGKRPSGLNENYAREIMELHTLGVDGGYTQKDVTELAKVLTGWTIDKPQLGGGFTFDDRRHEPGVKVVLGKKFKDDGEKEGLKALEMLAHSPATARFISKKLAMRFVSDEPPPALVERMADTFMKKDGDIREVLRTMYYSPEFFAPEAFRAKVKTPLEFLVSAVRASGADVQNPQALNNQLQKLGMPLYGMQPPTGYKMTADAWVNSAALLSRMNFGLALASGRVPGIQWSPENALNANAAPTDPTGALASFEGMLLDGDVSKQTHDTILKQLSDPDAPAKNNIPMMRGPNMRLIAGLLIGSPEFQRR